MDIDRDQADKIFLEKILHSVVNIKGEQKPRAVVLGGQPGSGKSAYARSLLMMDDSYVFINGDDLREYHPNYYCYLQKDDKSAADMTQKSVNYWVEELIRYCLHNKLNMIIEGTMRNKDVPIETILKLKQNGYFVSVAAMSVPYDLSVASINYRYSETKRIVGHARYTRIESHDEAFKKIENTVSLILQEGVYDVFCVVKRIGESIHSLDFLQDRKEEALKEFVDFRNRDIQDIERDFVNKNK